MDKYARPERSSISKEAVLEDSDKKLAEIPFPFPESRLDPEEQSFFEDILQRRQDAIDDPSGQVTADGLFRVKKDLAEYLTDYNKPMSPAFGKQALECMYQIASSIHFQDQDLPPEVMGRILTAAAQADGAVARTMEILEADISFCYPKEYLLQDYFEDGPNVDITEEVESDPILPFLAQQFAYYARSNQAVLRDVVLGDYSTRKMPLLERILKLCDDEIRVPILKELLLSETSNLNAVQMLLNLSPDLLDKAQNEELKPYLDWTDIRDQPLSIPEAAAGLSDRDRNMAELLKSDVPLELPFSDLEKFLDVARASKQKIDARILNRLGLDEVTFAEIVYAKFLKDRNSNIGLAIQFAWFYDQANILNISRALDASGLERGKQIPQERFDYVVSAVRQNEAVDSTFLDARKTRYLSPLEYELCLDGHPEMRDWKQPDFQKLGEFVHELTLEPQWDGDASLAIAFDVGRGTFGDETIIRYGNRENLSRHDAYYFMQSFIGMLQFNEPGWKEGESTAEHDDRMKKWLQTSGKKILLEVAKDDAAYADATAHHHLARVTDALAYADLAKDIERMKRYSNVAKLQELGAAFENGTISPFESWKMLKKWYDLHQLLGKTEVLEQLNSGDTTPKMREFVERLAFHPNISMDAVMTFWQKPADFLDIDDNHSPDTNEVKKPSNYLSLPHLGLKGEHLRDAYVEGELDDLQVIPPMARTYSFTESGVELDDPAFIHASMREAVGQARKGIEGRSRDSKKLFSKVQAFCKTNGLVFQDFFGEEKGVALMSELSSEQRKELLDLIFDKAVGMEAPKTDVYRIEIGKKSDPDMVVAGNDTASCMPFGSGKNNVYMFNPNCGQLVVQRRTGADEWRTAAQSVMTVDMQTSRSTPEMIEAYKDNTHLKDLLSEDDLKRAPVLTADNIEIAKNDEGRRTAAIQKVYGKFFEEYLREHGDELGVDPSRVVVGTGYTPAEFTLKREKNTYIPLAPMGYSDNVHEDCLVIETGLEKKDRTSKKGIAPLSTTDSVAVAVLEGKAYHDNKDVILNLHAMQNRIIGMEIANKHFDRPNLSFMYRDDKGVPRGYILAYEGEVGKQKEVFIDDLASDVATGNKMAGGRLIRSFFEAYKNSYGTEERPYPPLFMNARDQTSYQIIKKQMDKLAEEAGLVVQTDEVSVYERGGDIFHDVRIFVGKTHDEINTKRLAYVSVSDAQRYGIDESYGERSEDDRW
jgi:hypothetical protein